MKKFLIASLLFGLVVAVVGLLLPTAYSVERTVVIDAERAQIHAVVGELRRWPEWAPWEQNDPSIVTTYGETTTGPGASQSWTSDSGDGDLTFTTCDPAVGVAYDMAFIMDGKRAPAVASMSYATDAGGTMVVWAMEGDVSDMMPPVLSGYMNLLLPGEIGSMFDQGLESLKTLVESQG